MKRKGLPGAFAALVLCFGLGGPAAAQKPPSDAIDRTVLPVPEPKRVPITELDVRKAKARRASR